MYNDDDEVFGWNMSRSPLSFSFQKPSLQTPVYLFFYGPNRQLLVHRARWFPHLQSI